MRTLTAIWHAENRHACPKCEPGRPDTVPWRESPTSPWISECPADVVPEWVFDAARWFHHYERNPPVTPITFGRAAWLPGAYVEIMEEFSAAKAEHASKK